MSVSKDTSQLTVAVTGLNATDNPGPGVAVIRSLRADPAFSGRIVGLAYDSMEPGIYARDLVDDAFLIPYPSQGTDALWQRLEHIHERTGIDVVIPTLDAELLSFILLEERLRELGVSMYLPTREQVDMRSKVNLAKLGERIGISVPQTVILGGLDDLYGLHHRLAYPVVIKGVFYGASICRTIDEASKAYHCTVAQWGLPVIAQGYVEGEELNVVAVGDGEGGLVGAVAMKKVFVTDKGKGWAGITIRNPELLELTRTFVDKTGWRGPCELEVMRDAAGALHLLEVNPRFPAWVYLSQGAGCNLPAALLRLARGEAVEPMTDYQVGKMFVRISIDQIADLGDLESITATGELLAGPGLRQEFQHET